MTKTATLTLTDLKASAAQRIAAIDLDLSRLDEERGKLSLDFQLGDSGAEMKLRKLGEKYRVLHEQRDDATLAIAEAERRETEQVQKKRETAFRNAENARQQGNEERGRVLKRWLKLVAELADVTAEHQALSREIDAQTGMLRSMTNGDDRFRAGGTGYTIRQQMAIWVSDSLREAGLTDLRAFPGEVQQPMNAA